MLDIIFSPKAVPEIKEILVQCARCLRKGAPLPYRKLHNAGLAVSSVSRRRVSLGAAFPEFRRAWSIILEVRGNKVIIELYAWLFWEAADHTAQGIITRDGSIEWMQYQWRRVW